MEPVSSTDVKCMVRDTIFFPHPNLHLLVLRYAESLVLERDVSDGMPSVFRTDGD